MLRSITRYKDEDGRKGVIVLIDGSGSLRWSIQVERRCSSSWTTLGIHCGNTG